MVELAHAEGAPRLSLHAVLLGAGVVSSVLHVGADLIAALRFPAYHFFDQTISELSAIGAPTRTGWLLFSLLYAPMLAAFGVGVRAVAGPRRSRRIAGLLFVVIAVLGLVWQLFPMHLRGAPTTLTDSMHLAMATVSVPVMIAAIGFGAVAFGKPFRLYSAATVVVMLAAGARTGLDGPRIAAGLPTPWVGLFERLCVYSYLVWVAVFAIALFNETRRREASQQGGAPGFSAIL